jgi:ACT domain-containing protein
MSDADDVRAYTVRLELVDRPGELLSALGPIADQGGNLLSIFHERGNVTPRGHIPVEVDLEATPGQFEAIVGALQQTDINVMQAGQDRYGEEFVVVLVGDLVDADLSALLSQLQSESGASVRGFSLMGPNGGKSSARLRLAAESGSVPVILDRLHTVATERDLQVIEPLAPGGNA